MDAELGAIPGSAVFISCDSDMYLSMLRDRVRRALLQKFDLELVDPGLAGVPFFLVGHAGSSSQLREKVSRGNPLEVSLLISPEESAQVQEADLLTMLSEVLGRPKTSIQIYRERGPYPAAKKLYDGTYHLTGILEGEPSTLMHELDINLTQELRAQPAILFLPDPSRINHNWNEAAPGRFYYVFFTDPSRNDAPVIAVVVPQKVALPLVLSNPKAVRPELTARVREAVSYAYFLVLPEELSRTQEAERDRIEMIYLLSAYRNDLRNRYKALAFLGHLWMQRSSDPAYADKSELLQEQLSIDAFEARSMFRWLGLEMPRLEKREMFTADVSRLYQEALAKIESGMKRSGARRIADLETARRYLIAALMRDDQPKRIQGGRGLWSASHYNPYYHLGRIAFYLALERSVQKSHQTMPDSHGSAAALPPASRQESCAYTK
jgi:hypothetical protein